MKSLFKVSLLAATVALAAGCQKEEASQPEVSAVQEETQAVAMTFNTEDEKASYAIGSQFATFLKQSIEKPKELGIELDSALVLKGIEDGFADGSALSEEEIMMALQSLDQRVAEKAQLMAAEEAEKTIQAGADFRAEFEKQDGVTKTESGLLYQVLAPAEGESPAATDVVTVHYTGTLIDGTKFDSSVDRGEPASFPLDRVIAGWTEGVQQMQVGSKYKFVIPPELAYGQQDVPNIPANSTLVFEVELLEIVDQSAETAQ